MVTGKDGGANEKGAEGVKADQLLESGASRGGKEEEGKTEKPKRRKPRVVEPLYGHGGKGKLTDKATARMLDLHLKGYAAPAIAEMINVSTPTVQTALDHFKPVFDQLQHVDKYKSVKSDLLQAAQLKALQSALKEDKITDATVRDLAYAFDVFFKSGRLQDNESTSNTVTISHNYTKRPLKD